MNAYLRPTEWLSGSGGTGETPLHYRIASENALLAERRSRCPLEPVLGGPFRIKVFESRSPSLSGAVALDRPVRDIGAIGYGTP
jgi:hypothetical protein